MPQAHLLPDGLHWQQCHITLQATSFARKAHPLSVFEAILKGAKEAAGLQSALLWHWPDQNAQTMQYQPGQQIALQLQLFGSQPHQADALHQVLRQRLTGEQALQRHFSLVEASAWQFADATGLSIHSAASAHCTLNFHTPLPLPKKGHADRTAISTAEFLFACRKRIQKLWGLEPELPPAPMLQPLGWRYWRASHASQSQQGHTLLLNGCLGQLRLEGEQLQAWLPWLTLLAQVGMGERLSFGMGRFTLHMQPTSASMPVHTVTVPATAKDSYDETSSSPILAEPLRRPLHIERMGCKLSLDNDNLVIEGGISPGEVAASTDPDAGKRRYPLRLLQSVQCAQANLITSGLCHALAEHGIPLVLGQPGKTPLVYTAVVSEHLHYQRIAAHHRAHYSLTAEQQTGIAAQWVRAKLQSQVHLVRQRYQAGDNQLLHHLERALAALAHCDSVDAVRGWEGISARHYYPWLASQNPGLTPWQGRQRQEEQTPDALNSLLNYAYTLLRARIEAGVRAASLDPFLGVLHAPNGRHSALVSDFMEPLRAQAERLVLRLLGLQQIRLDDLQETAHGMHISTAARQLMVARFARQARRQGGLQWQLQALLRTYREAIEKGSLVQWQPQPPGPQDQGLDSEEEAV